MNEGRSEMFEARYRQARGDAGEVPWALQAPHPALTAWLDRADRAPARALVIACGLGDDAEELARRGWRVTAFDVSASAVAWAKRRFPATGVNYRVADLFALPAAWRAGFELVVEIRTLQSVEPSRRADAVAAVAGCVAPRGRAFVHCLLRAEDEPPSDDPPHPLARADLAGFGAAGLEELEWLPSVAADGRGAAVSAVFRRHRPPAVVAASG